MKYRILILFFISVLVVSCNKDTVVSPSTPPPSLLHKVYIGGELGTVLDYNEQNKLSKKTIGNGANIIEYYYDNNGNFTGFKEVVTYNPIFPIRRFDVEVNTSTRIEGTMKLYSQEDVEDPAQRQYYVYEISNGLLKSVYYREVQSGKINLEKYFYHNDDGNLNYYAFKKNPGFYNVAKFVAKEWDNHPSTSIHASSNNLLLTFYTLPGLDISINNITSIETFSGGGVSWGTSTYLLDYNTDGQITRRYSISEPSTDEDGNVTDPGGEEVTSATYEYIEGQ